MPAARRRITAAALKQQIRDFLTQALPAGWTSQPLDRNSEVAADILLLSPRGRCHFLFVRAPADRWWDGGMHSVPAERLTPETIALLQRLRLGGHRARAVWSAADLTRALRAWNCRPERPVRLPSETRPAIRRAASDRPPRPVLHLSAWGRSSNA